MIEREFIAQKTKELAIQQYLLSKLDKSFISSIKLKKIPLGEKILIETCKPSLVVGSKGSNIKALTKDLKQDFNLENPQIEISEIKNIYLDANLVAQKIASSLEKFGIARFKGIGHKVMENVMKSGARGVEIVVSGKVPSSRAKSWRFYNGYLKKCGDIAMNGVKLAHASALLKTGIIGIKVAIMPPDLVLPDHINIKDSLTENDLVSDTKGSLKEKIIKVQEESDNSGSDTKQREEKKHSQKKKITPRKIKKKSLEETNSSEEAVNESN